MSASLSMLAAPAVSLPQPTSGSGETFDAALAGAGDAGPFAALFLQALGKQIAADIDPNLLNLAGDVAKTVSAHAGDLGTEAEDALAALLPFLEGMGLLQPESVAAMPLAIPANATDSHALTEPSEGSATATGSAKSAVAPLMDGIAGLPSATSRDASPSSLLDTAKPQTGVAVPSMSAVEATDTGFAVQLKSALEQPATPVVPSTNVTMAAQASPAGTTPMQAPAPVQVAQPVGASGWGEEIGNHVVLMSNRMESRAELVLTPPQMGRVEVSLTVSGDQASASFVSTNPQVREALEAALPRLREILAEAGIQLGQAQVGAENPRQTAQQEKNGDNFLPGQGNEPEAGSRTSALSTDVPANPLKLGRGLVDVFA